MKTLAGSVGQVSQPSLIVRLRLRTPQAGTAVPADDSDEGGQSEIIPTRHRLRRGPSVIPSVSLGSFLQSSDEEVAAPSPRRRPSKKARTRSAAPEVIVLSDNDHDDDRSVPKPSITKNALVDASIDDLDKVEVRDSKNLPPRVIRDIS